MSVPLVTATMPLWADLEVETGPTVFTAIQEQLGLKLESRKDGVEVMVVDRADRVPVAN